MPKPTLSPEFDTLQCDLTETFLAGLHEWRPDLRYPESHSDMQGGMMALIRMFDVKRRPIALDYKALLKTREFSAVSISTLPDPSVEGRWVVRAGSGDGREEITNFDGPNAQSRAETYGRWRY